MIEHLSVYAVAGALILLPMYVMKVGGYFDPFDSPLNFMMSIGLAVPLCGGVGLWIWNILHGGRSVYFHAIKWVDGRPLGRKIKAYAVVSLWCLSIVVLTFCMFIFAAMQAGITK